MTKLKSQRLLIVFTSLILLAFLLINSGTTQASEQSANAKIQYGGWGLDKDERREAEEEALKNALEIFVVQNHPSHLKNYEKLKSQIEAQIDDYVLTHTITNSKQDKKSKTFEVWVRATINEPKLLGILVDKNQTISMDDQAYITFVFVARQVAGKQSRSDKSSSQTKSQSKTISNIDEAENAQMSKSRTNTIGTETIENTYTDKLLYEAATANEIDVAMGNVFSNFNYLVVSASLLEEETGYLLSVENFVKDYEKGNDLTPSTLSNALKGLKNLEDPIQYLAMGTLDIDEQQIDPKTNNYKVAVSVTGKIVSVQRRGAEMAVVKPTQYFGEGPTATVARNNALNLAAEEAANTLVAMLSAKNIR